MVIRRSLRSIIWAGLASLVALVAVGLAGGVAAAAPTPAGGLDLTVSVPNPLAPSLRLTNHTGATCRVAAQAFGAVTFTRVEQSGVPLTPVYVDAGLPDSLDVLVLAKLRPLDRDTSVDLPLRVVPFGPDGKGHALAALTWSAALGGTEVLYPLQAQGPLRLDVLYAAPRATDVCGPAAGSSAAAAPGGLSANSHRLLWIMLGGGAALLLAVAVVILLWQRRNHRRRVAGATVLALLFSLGLLGLDTVVGRPAFARIEASSAVIDDWIICSNIFHSPGGDPANILPALENPNILIEIDYGYHDAEANYGDRLHIDWDNAETGRYEFADSPGVFAEPCITLYHELYHAYEDVVFGGRNQNPCGLLDGKRYPRVSEVLATQAENRLRDHLHLPRRVAYDNLPLPPDGAPCVPFTRQLPSIQDRCWNLPSTAPLHPRMAFGQAAPVLAMVAPAAGAPCGGSNGDPHLRTLDGRFYDFQAVGEFVAARDPAGGYEVQVRQEPLSGSRVASTNTAVAMAVGADRVQFRLADRDLTFTVDGAARPLTTSLLPGGGKVTVTPSAGGSEVTVTWPDGSLVGLAPPFAWGIQIVVAPASARGGRLEGLLGDGDGDPANDIRTHGGAPIATPGFAALYPGFADSWRVSGPASLFSYDAGTSTETYTDRSFPDRFITASDLPGRAGAEALCRRAGVSDPDLLRDCTLDVGLTGQPDFAASARVAQELYGGFQVSGPPVALNVQAGAARVAFTGTAGTRVRVEAVSPVRSAQCASLTLRGPDGQTLATGCLREGAGQIDSPALPTAGAYTVVVDPASTGIGTVLVRIIPVADVTGAIVPNGPAVTAAVSGPGAVARLGFDGTQGQRVFVDIVSSTLPDSCWPVSLRAPDDSSIAISCVIDGTGYLDGTVLPSTGRYAVVIDPAGPETGTSTLRLVVGADEQVAITPGGAEAVATIAQPGAQSRLTFTGTAGQKVFLDVSSSGLPDACGVLELREPPGSHAIAAGCIIAGKGFIDGVVLPVTGVYTIVVNPAGRGTGVSHLRLLPVTDQQLTIVRNGSEVTATIGQPGGVSRLAFTGTAGTTVSVEVVSATLGDECGLLRLAGPTGTVFASGCVIGGKGGIATATLPATGQYTIIVDPSERATGQVRLRLH